MIENKYETNTTSVATAIVLENIKHSVLVVSVLLNLTIFVTWLTLVIA